MPHSLDALFLFAGPVSLILQISLCVHVYRTGRPYWWIWIIMMSSFVGCILYALLELLPDARRGGSRGLPISWFIPRSVLVRRAREALEETDSVTNRLALAALFYESGRKQEAEAVASACVGGVFKDDAQIISEVAWYKLALGKSDEAERLLSQADLRANRSLLPTFELLRARILHLRGRHDEALARLEALAASNLGEEPRYYAALCHYCLGEQGRALEVFDAIQKKYRKGGKLWRRAEKQWFSLSRRHTKALRKHQPIAFAVQPAILVDHTTTVGKAG